MLLFLLAAAPSKHRLAKAAEAYLAGDLSAVEEFEALHAERPEDPEVTLWLARARVEGRRCQEASSLLADLDAGARGDAWRGLAARCLGEDPTTDLAQALAGLRYSDPLFPAVSSALGLALLESDPERAVSLLYDGGIDPRRSLVDAPDLIGFGFPYDLLVTYEGQRWLIEDGIGRPTTRAPAGCGLAVTPEGVKQNGEVVVPALAGVADIVARCDPSGGIWVLRRDPDGAVLLGPEGPFAIGQLNIITFDVNETVLLLEVLTDDRVGHVAFNHGQQGAPLPALSEEFRDPEFLD